MAADPPQLQIANQTSIRLCCVALPERLSFDRNDFQTATRLLGHDDLSRLQAYLQPESQWRLLSARLLIKHLFDTSGLGRTHYFARASNGRPLLICRSNNTPSSNLSISISHHKREVAVCLSSAGPVGIDIVDVMDFTDWQTLAPSYLRPEEIESIDGRSVCQQRALAAMSWAAKESVLKMVGLGLTVDPRGLAVEAYPDLRLTHSDLSGIKVSEVFFTVIQKSETTTLTLAFSPHDADRYDPVQDFQTTVLSFDDLRSILELESNRSISAVTQSAHVISA